MARTEYFNLSIPAPKRLAMMRADFAAHPAKYLHCPERAKPRSWRAVRNWTLGNWQTAFITFSAGQGQWYCHTGGFFKRELWASDAGGTGYRQQNLRGYYTEDGGPETARGFIVRLPHGRFLAGYGWSRNGERVYYPKVYNDETEAALAADRHAERFADSARADDARFQAMALAELDVETKTAELEKALALRFRPKFGGRDRVRDVIPALRKARETLAEATRNYERA